MSARETVAEIATRAKSLPLVVDERTRGLHGPVTGVRLVTGYVTPNSRPHLEDMRRDVARLTAALTAVLNLCDGYSIAGAMPTDAVHQVITETLEATK